jgi:hypothetical protein
MPQNTRVRAPVISFIVRVWPDDEHEPQMRGEVEHVGTGERRLFVNEWSLVSLIDSWRRDLEAVG